jgi:hypothetical protein
MVTTPVLFDTCILIDYLKGIASARTACDRHSDRAISIITWMEVLAGIETAREVEIRSFLLNFHTLPLTPAIAERAVAIRRARRIKLPDAVIQATAEEAGRTLITRNTRDFPQGFAGTHIPYTV